MDKKITLNINGRECQAKAGETVLDVTRRERIDIPVLCYLEGLSKVGACRLCLVEMEGSPKLFPACTTPVEDKQVIRTESERLKKYRRMTIELFFSEGNHICSVCVANRSCELQDMAVRLGMEHVRFPYFFLERRLDATHEEFVFDANRCILCTRCVRTCDEVEGAHVWDVMGRGFRSAVIADFNQLWGDSETCTSCGKCIQACPTGALWPKTAVQGQLNKNPALIAQLVDERKARP